MVSTAVRTTHGKYRRAALTRLLDELIREVAQNELVLCRSSEQTFLPSRHAETRFGLEEQAPLRERLDRVRRGVQQLQLRLEADFREGLHDTNSA
jgi:hypothetical protein